MRRLNKTANNIMQIEYEEYGIPMIALFDNSQINEDEVRHIIESGEHSDKVICVYKSQFQNVFKSMLGG